MRCQGAGSPKKTRRAASSAVRPSGPHASKVANPPRVGSASLGRPRGARLDSKTFLSTSTLQRLLSTLRRVIRWAEARDLVGRNVAMLCTAPTGMGGRPSNSLTMTQAQAVMRASEGSRLHAYVVLALLTGVRTGELRALT
jgi:hypothetical protein